MAHEPNDRAVMVIAAFLHGGLTLGVVVYGVVAAFIGPLGSAPPVLQTVAVAAAGVAAVVALACRAVLRRRITGPDSVMPWVIIPAAVLEGAACLGITTFLLSGNPIDVIGPAVLVLLMLATWPTSRRIAAALGIEDGGENVYRGLD